MPTFTVRELAEALGAPWEGDGDHPISGVAPVDMAGTGEITFAGGKKVAELVAASAAGCVLVPERFTTASGRTLIRVKDPRGAFARVVLRFHPPRQWAPGIHRSAAIDPSAEIGEGCAIGPHVSIGHGSRIGRGSVIGPGCRIAEDVMIGHRCRLHANVSVYPGSQISDRVILHAGVVIGADGFGFVMSGDHYEKFPQVGRVRIGNDVEIGANSCVDRAALGVTSIGDGTKIDNMVHIGHNCQIGRHVVVAAQTGFSGGVVVEDYAVIGGQVGIGDKVRIEKGAVLGSGCGVLTSKIVRAGHVMWGTPARPLKEHLEQLANLSRLPEMRRELRELRKVLDELLEARASHAGSNRGS
jgi:UDP-3-O-[3-hydroxymyristoyl] glucosamine N-acyltransferase